MKATDSRPFLLLYNPVAGGGAAERRAREIGGRLSRLGHATELAPTPLPFDLRHWQARAEPPADTERGDVFAHADAKQHRAAIIFGGDGTLNEAINRIADPALPIAFCGTGSTNVLRRALGIPRDDEEFVEMVLAGRVLRSPAIAVQGRLFLIFVDAGFLGRALREYNARPRARGFLGRQRREWTLAGCVLKQAWSARQRPLELEILDGEPVSPRRRYTDILVARVPQYGGRFLLPLRTSLADDEFEVFGFQGRGLFTNLLPLLLAGGRLLGRCLYELERRELFLRRRARRIRIHAAAGEREPSHVDAESFLPVPLEVAACPDRGVGLLVPAAAGGIVAAR